jgi:ssDNA-binding Zn-finger/Zn-ribbon topoisomerase 1
MLAVCPVCGSALEERRNRATGLPYLACTCDPTCPGTAGSIDGNGLARPGQGGRSPGGSAASGSARGRWLRAARRAIFSLTN